MLVGPHVAQHIRLVPLFKFLYQFRLVVAHSPSKQHRVVVERIHRDVSFVGLQPAHHFRTVATHLHAQLNAQMLSQLLAQQIVYAQMMTVIVVVSVRSAHGHGDQLARLLNLREVKQAVAVLVRSPRRCCVFLLLTSRKHPNEEYNYTKESQTI